jgi:hypothetical protein
MNDVISVQVLKEEVFDKGFNAFKPIAEFIEAELNRVDKRFKCNVDLKTRRVWVYEGETLIGDIGKSGWSFNRWEVKGDEEKLRKLANYIFKHY